MRKIVGGSFITLDGVMQAAGGPEDGFKKYGGWSAPYYGTMGAEEKQIKKTCRSCTCAIA